MRFIAAFTVVLSLLCEAPLPAKGLTSRIRIRDFDDRSTIELTNPNLLDRFDVWAGPGTFVDEKEETRGFIIDWSTGIVPTRPRGLRRLEISFFMVPIDGVTEQLAYVVLYEHDPISSHGFVYLPGRTDQQFVINSRTIVRGNGLEGNWFHATSEWERTLGRLLAQR